MYSDNSGSFLQETSGQQAAAYAAAAPGINPNDAIAQVLQAMKTGRLKSLVRPLPLLLNLKGRPYSLIDHFPFEDMFRFRLPTSCVYKTGRQVAKTTGMAARGVLLTASIPHFTTLYVTPLYEQIRRFSSTYIGPFIQESPIQSYITGPDCVSSVLHRTFRNKSQMVLSFAFLNANRIRGIASSAVSVDESVASGTIVETPIGDVKIENLVPGDVVHAADEFGQVQKDTVVKVSDHGYRDCYQLTLSSGKQVEATVESFFGTTEGWKTVESIVADHFNAVSRANAARNDAGRRQYGADKNKTREPLLCKSARIQTARVQHREIPGIIRVRFKTTTEREERRLRRLVESLADQELSGTVAYRVLVSPQRQKARDTGVARQADLGGNSLVVSGRRQSFTPPCSNIPHRRFHPDGGGIIGLLADAEGYRSTYATRKKPPCPRQAILGHPPDCRLNICSSRAYSPIHLPGDDVQSCTTTTQYNTDLPTMRTRICSGSQPWRQVQQGSKSVVSQPRMPETSYERAESKATGESRASCRDKQTTTGETGSRGASGTRYKGGIRSEVPYREPREIPEIPTTVSCCASNRAANPTLYTLQRTVYSCSTQRADFKILSSMSQGCDEGEPAAACGEEEVVAIKYVGQKHVYDIETAQYHSFFAGGFLHHNCQDLDSAFTPIILETMSASEWRFVNYFGTPKTLDNTLEGLWQESSMAEWFVPCYHCTTYGKPTMNIPSADWHLDKMIGPYSEDISEELPATICHKCGKPINPRRGMWVHRFPDLRWIRAGYHIPQILLPMHYAQAESWASLLTKRETMPTNIFSNEVLGESSDIAARLVTKTDLQSAARGVGPNTLENAQKIKNHYNLRVMAIDWGGGGQKETSFTTFAMIGMQGNGTLDVFFGKRLHTPHAHIEEAKELLAYWNIFEPAAMIHDYGGAGTLRETFMVQAGVSLEQLMPCIYTRTARKALCYHIPSTEIHPRDHYGIDKARAFQLVCALIKLNRIRFFDYDNKGPHQPGLLSDFTALYEDKIRTMSAGDMYIIRSDTNRTDDFADAVNIGCVGIWYMTQSWPNLPQLSGLATTEAQLRAAMGPSSG